MSRPIEGAEVREKLEALLERDPERHAELVADYAESVKNLDVPWIQLPELATKDVSYSEPQLARRFLLWDVTAELKQQA